MSDAPIVRVEDLHVHVQGTPILRGVSFELHARRTLGVVGESGCGKTMTGLTLMGMLPATAQIVSGRITLDGEDVTHLKEGRWRQKRGELVSMIMQDPFTSLNPMMRVGDQIAEVLELHGGKSGRDANKLAIEWLERVGVPEPEASAQKFPHQMSGGQRQRVVIAAAFAAHPRVIVADEPTTALDVTLQATILRLLKQLQAENGTAVMLITHDIGVVASIADEVAVFYAGQAVERGPTARVLKEPAHPYTQALLAAVPQRGQDRLTTIGGYPPRFGALPAGCAFSPRCPHAFEKCAQEPELFPIGEDQSAACWLHAEVPSIDS